MEATAWGDLDLTPVAGEPGRYTATISDPWMLIVVPQGGIVAALAAQAMADLLDEPEQSLRTITAVFAGQVATGPVDIEVKVLRQGRSMSQLTATVHNGGAEAGLTAIAAFGRPRRGVDFTDLTMPDVQPPDELRSFRDSVPEGVDFEFSRPVMPFWDQVVDGRPAIGRAPWEPFDDRPAECASWFRLDDPPTLPDGRLDPLAFVVMCDTMPGAAGQKIGPEVGSWFGPSVDLTVHLLADAEPGWFLGHNRARHAGDGYASVDQAIWTPDGRLLAYATQLMFFAFGV